MSQIGVILKAMVAVLVLFSVVVGISQSAINVEGKNSVGLASFGLAIPPLHLTAPRNFVTGPIPSQVIPMDLDGDGDLDIAVKCSDVLGGPQLQLFENPGDGTLVLHSAISLPADTELVPADLNGDGRLDLAQVHTVATIKGELLTMLQNGHFSFTTGTLTLPFPCSHLCVGNLDGIKGLDLVIGDDLAGPRVYVYLADGTGSFTLHGNYDTEQADRDVNQDGTPDVQTPLTVHHCVCADLDGDGDEDLIVTNSILRKLITDPPTPAQGVTNVVALFNQGDGTLGPFNILMDPGGAQLQVADMDGDGDQDMVTTALSLAGPDKDAMILLRNIGNGAFLPAERFASGGGIDDVGGVELCDVDGDGDLDVGIMLFGPMSGNLNDKLTDHWALLRNDGQGNLGAPEIYPAGADILDLAFADLDGSDGPEALTVAGDDDRLSVHYNQGGQYPAPALIRVDDPRSTIGGTTVLDITSGDFNNDGLMDLGVITDSSQLLGDGPDTLFVLDGIPGGVSSIPSLVDLPEGPVRILADQIAGSSATDIGVVFIGSPLFGDPAGVGLSLGVDGVLPGPIQFTTLNGMPADLAALDVNTDGTRDLAVLRIREEGLTAGISILSVADDGTLTYLSDLILGSDDVMDFDTRLPYVITSADMDGDGLRDLVAVTWNTLGTKNGIVSVILNNGDLTFTLVGEFLTVAREVTDVIATDVTGDGLPDVILTTVASLYDAEKDGSLELIPNLGGGVLGTRVSYNVGIGPVRVAACQMDNMTGLDLVVANDGSNEITILFNDGLGRFPTQERYLSCGGTDGLTIADLDQDGNPDVAVCNDENISSPGERDHRGTVSILINIEGNTAPKRGALA